MANQYTKAKELGLPKPEVSIETRKKLSEAFKGRKLTEDQKKKISESQKRNFENGKSRWAFDRSKKSYAEQYFENWLNSFTKFKMNLRANRFYLDFAWPDKWIYLEVDGEQHFESDAYIKRDKERDMILSNDGWRCIARIRWSWFKGLSDLEKENYLNSLKNVILGIDSKPISFISEKEKRDLEYSKKIEEARKNGTLTKNGKLHNCIKPSFVWEERKNLILNCGADFSKFGWKTEVQKLTGLSRRVVDNTISRFNEDFKNVFIRNKGL